MVSFKLRFTPGKTATYWTAGWVVPRAELDAVAKRQISAPARNSLQPGSCTGLAIPALQCEWRSTICEGDSNNKSEQNMSYVSEYMASRAIILEMHPLRKQKYKLLACVPNRNQSTRMLRGGNFLGGRYAYTEGKSVHYIWVNTMLEFVASFRRFFLLL
jgi:hypothetical protein